MQVINLQWEADKKNHIGPPVLSTGDAKQIMVPGAIAKAKMCVADSDSSCE